MEKTQESERLARSLGYDLKTIPQTLFLYERHLSRLESLESRSVNERTKRIVACSSFLASLEFLCRLLSCHSINLTNRYFLLVRCLEASGEVVTAKKSLSFIKLIVGCIVQLPRAIFLKAKNE